MTVREFTTKDELLAAAGTALGSSEWTRITREMVHQFAESTGDHQWIHVDDERAARESPFGGAVAHGYLMVSLLPMLTAQIYRNTGARLNVNYGSNRVRFPSPVPVGSHVRSTAVLTSAEELPNGSVHLVVTHTLEVEGRTKPALTAETITRAIY